MARALFLCAIPLLAGCFAWDMDEKTLPWDEPRPVDTSIGQVCWNDGEPIPADLTDTKHFPAFYEFPKAGARRPVPPPPVMQELQEGEGELPAEAEAPDDLPSEPPATTVESEATTTEAAPAANPGLEKKIEALESRIEELYQLLLKSYEKK